MKAATKMMEYFSKPFVSSKLPSGLSTLPSTTLFFSSFFLFFFLDDLFFCLFLSPSFDLSSGDDGSNPISKKKN